MVQSNPQIMIRLNYGLIISREWPLFTNSACWAATKSSGGWVIPLICFDNKWNPATWMKSKTFADVDISVLGWFVSTWKKREGAPRRRVNQPKIKAIKNCKIEGRRNLFGLSGSQKAAPYNSYHLEDQARYRLNWWLECNVMRHMMFKCPRKTFLGRKHHNNLYSCLQNTSWLSCQADL